MKVKGFNHLTVNVKNLRESLHFYAEILGLQVVHKGNKDAYLEWGSAWICLVEQPEYEESVPNAAGIDHIAFSIEEEHFAEAVEILRTYNIPITRGPVKRGIGWSVNFLDPDGTRLELHTSNLAERMSVWK
ncbi:VOC family protein [Paenibacillus albidus]|uniref:VOC family protein n=1 Tax=Paenibacillus albidus TaxID=2041023 RepID=UPI001BED1FBB|nr:VOC family protein [Paenibacillus albidus]MBT2290785.1 VOC family protein [Paenibacillus albidus]